MSDDREEERDAIPDLIQPVNQLYYIVALNAFHPLLIFLAVEFVADLVRKLGRRSIELKELVHGIEVGG